MYSIAKNKIKFFWFGFASTIPGKKLKTSDVLIADSGLSPLIHPYP
jgi:hypothetical protein